MILFFPCFKTFSMAEFLKISIHNLKMEIDFLIHMTLLEFQKRGKFS